MKKIYTLLLLLLGALSLQAQIVNIPDANLKSLLLSNADTNQDNQIQISEAMAVNSLTVFGANPEITDLTGLDAFTNLTYLELRFLNVSAPLSLSSFTHLENVYFFSTSFTSIDFSGMISLESVSMSSTPVQTLTFNNLPNLANVSLDSMITSQIEFSSLPLLTAITIDSLNSLSTLNMSELPSIRKLFFYGVPITNLDINTFNSLEEIYLVGSGITSLDISGLSNLKSLSCGSNTMLTSVNTTGATAITDLEISSCRISSIDVGAMTQLVNLNVSGNVGYDFSSSGLTSLNVQGLNQLKSLICSSNSIPSLNLNGLTQLTHLECSQNLLTQLDVSMLTQLTYLGCGQNQLSSLNVMPLTQLKSLGCYYNNLSTLDLSTLTHLEKLYCQNNLISNLNISANTQLNNIDCSYNSISSLDFAANHEIKKIECGNNPLTNLNLTSQNKFKYLSCNYTLISTINISGFDVLTVNAGEGGCIIDLSDNPNLEYINAKYGLLNTGYGLFLINCQNLRYICADDDNIPFIQNRITLVGLQNVSLTSYCTFTPGGAYNTIAGMISYDLDGNGCDTSDYMAPLMKMNINDGTQTGATFTNSIGNYSFFTQAGNYTLTPTLESPYFTVTPASAIINFPSLDQTTQTQNFCISPLGVHYDVEFTLLSNITPRPGFYATYQIVYKNTGNQIQSGTIDLAFDDAVLDFLNASPTNSSQTTNHLTWNYSNLYPFESRVIYIKFRVNGPTETPPVNIGDILNYTTTLSLNGEGVPPPTQAQLVQTVVGAYDPNDKTCLEGNNITPEMVGDYLHYLIRFQNTGTAPAEFVVVKDMLDTQVFDVSSLQLISSSHPMTTRITGNKAEFIFENINLPGESVDEPASHGFVAFKIKTKNNLVLGNTVKNKAEIYFDYNFPVITNQTTTTVSLLATQGFDAAQVSMTPNPTQNLLNISANCNLQKIELLDMQGRVLERYPAFEREASIYLSGKANGMYLVKVTSDKGSSVQKIIKE